MRRTNVIRLAFTSVALAMTTLAAFSAIPVVAQQASCPALGPKALIGVVGGGAAGAGLGAVLSHNKGQGALIGGLAGALVGGVVGSSMDQRDCQQAQAALRQAAIAQTGQQVTWVDPPTGNHGTFTPVNDPAPNANGQMCRQYKRDMVIGGRQTGGDVGVVCQSPNGDYQAVQ